MKPIDANQAVGELDARAKPSANVSSNRGGHLGQVDLEHAE
jgi:hypothetical protein